MAASYEARLRALGRRIDAEMLSSVCVTEVEEGFLVVGLGILTQGVGVARAERTLEFSYADVDALVDQMQQEQRAP
jgi:hypothetical protein